MSGIKHLTPTEIVSQLDKYIIGQDDAKRAVAIAIRNRWRRQNLSDDIRNEVAPKNIIMAGPTGVGKTEIARRLASLVGAPFVKVEATKFTEVGYVGRDVESMVRDLLERGIAMVREEMAAECESIAELATEQRILDCLMPSPFPPSASPSDLNEERERQERTRSKLREQLREGKLNEREIEITVEEKSGMPVGILSNVGFDQMDPGMQDFIEKLMPSRKARKKARIEDARKILFKEELDKLIDHDKMIRTAIQRTEEGGIVFLDEIDKICGSDGHGPDVSREGVQRDLLPLVEGCSVNTRHGMVNTDHILFIAAGAFSKNKPSDLMPELQGRFPIRVKLKDLDKDQFIRILTEPQNALTRQQIELLKTEEVNLVFTGDGIAAIAQKAFDINESQQNIGARRLYAVMEKVLEQISFDAPDHCQSDYQIDAEFVNKRIKESPQDEDLNIFGFARARTK